MKLHVDPNFLKGCKFEGNSSLDLVDEQLFKASHPAARHFNSLTNLKYNCFYLTDNPYRSIDISTLPVDSIKPLVPMAKTHFCNARFHKETIAIDPLNFFCTSPLHIKFPSREKTYYSKHTTPDSLDVWWSDNPCVSTETAAKKFHIPDNLKECCITNSKGVRKVGYFIADLTPRDDYLNFKITKPQRYSTESISKLIAWEKEGKSIRPLSQLTSSKKLIIPILKSFDDVIKPNDDTPDPEGHSCYTVRDIKEYIREPKFWEQLLEIEPELTGVFSELTDETLRNEVFCVMTLKILSK